MRRFDISRMATGPSCAAIRRRSSIDGNPVERQRQQSIDTSLLVKKGGNHRHFMEKEIHEQPEVISHALAHHLDLGLRGLTQVRRLGPLHRPLCKVMCVQSCGSGGLHLVETRMIGVLGGMGPLATIDLMQKIIMLTRAATDQEHIPVVAYSDPTIPDRRAALFDPSQQSPLPKMIAGLKGLERSGAECIVIACNTAHHWIPILTDATKLPILHIADAVCAALSIRARPGTKVGILATNATLFSGFYDARLRQHGFIPVRLTHEEISTLEQSAIALVKRGEIEAARPFVRDAVNALHSKGIEVVILACTELPLAIPRDVSRSMTYIDATECLAQSAINWYRDRRSLLSSQTNVADASRGRR